MRMRQYVNLFNISITSALKSNHTVITKLLLFLFICTVEAFNTNDVPQQGLCFKPTTKFADECSTISSEKSSKQRWKGNEIPRKHNKDLSRTFTCNLEELELTFLSICKEISDTDTIPTNLVSLEL